MKRIPHFSRGAIIWQAFAIALFIGGCGPQLRLYDWPIEFTSERMDLTRDYALEHYGIEADNIEITPRMIVLHWTAIDNLADSFRAFDPIRLPAARDDIAVAGQVNVSIHFLVDRDGTVYQLMPENWMARHSIGLNYVSVGVENVGGADGEDDLTDEQIKANASLVRQLVRRHPTIDYLIGHYEYTAFEGHPLWMERDSTYRTHKVDPGIRFMSEVRSAVADLGLRGAPSGPS